MEVNKLLIRNHLSDITIYSDQVRTTCPLCGPYRKKQNERTLSVTFRDDVALYYCHHCEEGGQISMNENLTHDTEYMEPPEVPIRKTDDLDKLSDDQIQYLASRGISKDTADALGVVSGKVYIPKRGGYVNCIGFKYENNNGSPGFKWRDGSKNFSQQGVCKTLWKIEQFGGGDLVICEGEMDTLSFHEVGILAVSVPNGAPNKLSTKDSGKSNKFSYLWDAKEYIAIADRVIIATDADDPGGILGEEIARRIGKAKCWTIKYPDGCKDANDVLVKHGKDALFKCYEDATPWPVGGLRDASEFKEVAIDIFRKGMERGIDLGIPDLARIYKPSPQTLVVCTGMPGQGKSTFITWVSYMLAERHDWPCAIFSPETSSQIHLLNIAALRANAPYMGPDKMTESDLVSAIDWASDRFVFIDESDTSITSIIERAQAAVLRNGVRFLIVDPYNWITSDEVDMDNQHLSINKMLVKLKTFASEHDISVVLVAHPTKMYRGSDGSIPVPKGYDISGSASFFNVADVGLTVVRDQSEHNAATIHCWKVRYPWLGSVSKAKLRFDPKVGRYSAYAEWGTKDEDWNLRTE